jgi:hypothetical protein
MLTLTGSEQGQVVAVCHQWGLAPAPIFAIIEAEGGSAYHLIKAVQCSEPTITTFIKALDVACRSYVHALSDEAMATGLVRVAVMARLQRRWAPLGVDNDPKNLNANWLTNVLSQWEKREPVSV